MVNGQIEVFGEYSLAQFRAFAQLPNVGTRQREHRFLRRGSVEFAHGELIEAPGRFRHREAERLQAILADDFARMGRIEHLHDNGLWGSLSRQPHEICSSIPACFCKWLRTLKRLSAFGFPFGPNMRIRLFGGVPMLSPSAVKPIVALM